MTRRVAVAAVVLLMAACASPSGDQMSTPSPSSSPASRSSSAHSRFSTAPPLPSQSGRPVELPADRLRAIKDDLAARGVSGDPTVVSTRAVTWRDGSWGCPLPGKQYAQALVDGLQVIVTVGEERYDYRFGAGPTPRLCEPREP